MQPTRPDNETRTIELLSLNIGAPQQRTFEDGAEFYTGICKDPVTEPLFLSQTNLAGDGQGDLVHHGGVDKAVNVYSIEHYPFWEKELGKPLGHAAFGENLTVRGLLETDVCIGDTFQLGEAVVQVSQPRIPCGKLNSKHNVRNLRTRVRETGYSGFYLRVLKEGMVSPAKDTLVLLERDPNRFTVAEANRIAYHDFDNLAALQRLHALEPLADAWKNFLGKQIADLQAQSPQEEA